MKKSLMRAPFFGLQDRMPVVLALLLGFQHGMQALAFPSTDFYMPNQISAIFTQLKSFMPSYALDSF